MRINVLEAIKIWVERLFASKKLIFLPEKQVVCNIIDDAGGSTAKIGILILNAKNQTVCLIFNFLVYLKERILQKIKDFVLRSR